MTSNNKDILTEFYKAVRRGLIGKLRQSRLAPLMRDVDKYSRPGFTNLGIVTGMKDSDFVGRFGVSLDKVTDADIAALTLYLPEQDSLMMALGKLAEHIDAAPEGMTGLPYFDEWNSTHDSPSEKISLVWACGYQDEPRRLIEDGYRIVKSKPLENGSPECFVTDFVSSDEA